MNNCVRQNSVDILRLKKKNTKIDLGLLRIQKPYN